MWVDNKFHRFDDDVSDVALPSRFTFPFHYVPHELTIRAARQVRRYVARRIEWRSELDAGKMLGVLVVRNCDGELGFLAAFSGNLAHATRHEYFVPPVYDLLVDDGFFPAEEARISVINHEIHRLQHDSRQLRQQEVLRQLTTDFASELQRRKALMKLEKERRDAARAQGTADEDELVRQSQFAKAELKRYKAGMEQKIESLQAEIGETTLKIDALKDERKRMSIQLQERIFQNFVMINGNGGRRNLCEIFSDTPQGAPPAGAGECAAPKLVQYAFLHRYQLISMGEFWIGASPKEVIRREGHFYGACKNKCEPILNFMLQGVDVEDNQLAADVRGTHSVEVVYEDAWLMVVNKPAGLQSVPGKLTTDSVAERVALQGGVRLVVHRLDMATSGLLLIAKSKETHKRLQAMFKTRSIKKRYCAWLDGNVAAQEGEISLPMTLQVEDRPRQMVSYRHGKSAVTRFVVVARKEGRTKVLFYPLTGRTHQLRVHAAHVDGLNAPIVGDRLYGKPADRLYLHAESLEFEHPFTGLVIKVEAKAPF